MRRREGKVRHLARVKEGKHGGGGVTDGAEQGDGFQRETSGEGKSRESSPARRLPGETAAHIGELRVSFRKAQSSCRTFCDRQESHRTTQNVSGLASHPAGGASGKLSDVDRRDVDSSFLPGFVFARRHPLPSRGGGGGGESSPEGVCGSASEQAKGTGYAAVSLYGQALEWRGRGQPSGVDPCARPPISGDTRAARSGALSG